MDEFLRYHVIADDGQRKRTIMRFSHRGPAEVYAAARTASKPKRSTTTFSVVDATSSPTHGASGKGPGSMADRSSERSFVLQREYREGEAAQWEWRDLLVVPGEDVAAATRWARDYVCRSWPSDHVRHYRVVERETVFNDTVVLGGLHAGVTANV